MMKNETKVRVAVRSRPAGEESRCVKLDNTRNQVIVFDNEVKQFSFDHVFDSSASQQVVYQTLAKPILEQFKNGYNACIMAYGQTGSGKTFTMGTGKTVAQEYGIVPRLMEEFFKEFDNTDTLVTVSFIEVYNNDVFDLLSAEQTKINVREDSSGIKLPDLTEETVGNLDDALKHLEYGIDTRRTSSTVRNGTSSRSHAIFTISTQLKETSSKCRLQLVDLAGSEGAETWNMKSVAREGISINKSLLALGNVIKALKEKQNHIPYRSSILTRLLQESLGGRSYTVMIGCINPKMTSLTETVNTIRFASKACGITNLMPTSVNKRKTATTHLWKPTPLRKTHFNNSAECLTPNYSAVMSKMRKEFFSTPNLQKLATGLKKHLSFNTVEMEKTCTPLDLAKHPAPEPKLPAFTFEEDEIFDDEVMTGSLLLPSAEEMSNLDKVPQITTTEKVIRRSERISQRKASLHVVNTSLEDLFSVPQKPKRKTKRSILQETIMSESMVLPDSITSPKGTRYRTMLIPESSFCGQRWTRNKENSFADVSTLNSTKLNFSRRLKLNVNAQAQNKNNETILRLLNCEFEPELEKLPLIGKKTAWIIWQWRQIHGDFKSICDLQMVQGLPKQFYTRFLKATLVNLCE